MEMHFSVSWKVLDDQSDLEKNIGTQCERTGLLVLSFGNAHRHEFKVFRLVALSIAGLILAILLFGVVLNLMYVKGTEARSEEYIESEGRLSTASERETVEVLRSFEGGGR